MSSNEPPDLRNEYHTFLRTTSIAMLVLAPIIIALPPLKMDIYTIGLGCAFVASANHLSKDESGRSAFHRVAFGQTLPPRALEVQQQQQQQRKGRLLEEPLSAAQRQPTALEAKARQLWMGGETEGWKERRLKEEQEKINQGEGYGSMIVDQIWEVWNWGDKKGHDGEQPKKDEK